MTDDNSKRFSLDELAKQLAESVPQNLKVLGQDLERNFKALLQSGLERMELVTREEFDLQRAVLERTREKLEAMEGRLAEIAPPFFPTAGLVRSDARMLKRVLQNFIANALRYTRSGRVLFGLSPVTSLAS